MFLILACGISLLVIGLFFGVLLTCAIAINSIRKIDYSSLYGTNNKECDDDLDDESNATQE